MTKKFKSYKEYLEQDKLTKIRPEKIAPPDALPKTSRGDSHRSRRIAKVRKNLGVVEVRGVKISKEARKRLES